MPHIVNNFNSVLSSKGYLEYLIYQNNIVVCEFSALDTLHNMGYAHKFQTPHELNRALIATKFGYAKLSISTPDKLIFKLPINGLRQDARLRDDVIWFCNYIYKALEVNIIAEFLRKPDLVKKLHTSNPEFLRLAIYSET